VNDAQLDALVLPILEAKYELGLFEHPYVDESKVEATLTRPEGLALEKKVAVIGLLADSARDIEGGWTVEGLFGGPGKSHPVTVLAGIKNKLGPDAQVTYVAGPPMARLYPSLFDLISGTKPAPPPTAEEVSDWLAK